MKPNYNLNIGGKILTINQDNIGWEYSIFNTSINNPTKIRYGAKPIEVDLFSIGTNFKIDLSNDKGECFSISIKSYFGINKKEKYNNYSTIINAIWDTFFAEKFNNLIYDWEKGKPLQTDKYSIDLKSIIKKKKSTSLKGVNIEFNDMQLFTRYDHLLINSIKDPSKHIKLDYSNDWNWPLIEMILYKITNTTKPLT